MSEQVRVRFAPSPTGYLHVGGARTALFNYLYARQQGGVFVLRIEDTDRERSSDEMTQAILDGMRWLGLEWDEGPHHQADGFDRHRQQAVRLLEEGKAYRCFCTTEELEAKRRAAGEEYRYDRLCQGVEEGEGERRAREGEPHTIRFRVQEGATEWEDLVHGPTRWGHADIEDFVLLRTDGTPVYNLAVVSDDLEMGITHVLRGDDHLANTPKQILLYQALGARPPRFGHLPMILGSDGKRLSKRHGATAVGDYAAQGILPQALVNFLALLGWSPGDDTELMEMPELIARFSLERILKKASVFDPQKLEWMSAQYLYRMDAGQLLDLAAPHLMAAGLASEEELRDRQSWFLELVEVLKVRVRRPQELPQLAATYILPEVEFDAAAVEKHWKDPAEVAPRLVAVRDALAALPEWEGEALEAALRATAEAQGVGFGKLVHPLRVSLTGTAASPGIQDVLRLLGRELATARIDRALELLAADTQPRS
jgi:glutamyl-tRNA synthetase